jgi:membrane protease YdiL (CAAX protease family)
MLKRNQLVLFFILTFAISWMMWLPAALTKLSGGTSILGPDGVGQFGRWAPGIVAIILTGIVAGKQGLGALFHPLKIWRINIGWYFFALLFQPVLFFIAKWIDALLGNIYQINSPLTTGVDAPIAFVIPVVIITAIPGAFIEELGWRGFALPRLQNKNTALVASIILGLIWGIWHIPSMLYFGETNGLTIGLAVLNTIPLAILFTWLFNNTQGSLLLVMLFHASLQYSNNFLGTIPSGTADIITWLVAIIVLINTGANHLSKSTERIQSE